MGSQRDYQPHKPILSVLLTDATGQGHLDGLITETFGTFDSRSEPIDFTFTTYYDEELGTPITRLLYSLTELVAPTQLAQLKASSNSVEARTARPDGRRILNLDPGLLSLSRLILATTKASAHRIPIGMSMFAEITLLYRQGGYRPLEWTYPDFRSGAYDQWLLSVRGRYHEQLRELDPERSWRL